MAAERFQIEISETGTQKTTESLLGVGKAALQAANDTDAASKSLRAATQSMASATQSLLRREEDTARRQEKIWQTMASKFEELERERTEVMLREQRRREEAAAKESSSLGGIGRLAGGVAVGAIAQRGLSSMMSSQDTMAALTAQLQSADAANDVLTRLRETAMQTGTTIEGNIDTFRRLQLAVGDTTSIRDLVQHTENMSKVFATAGVSGAQLASVQLQLGQALSMGALQGQEFRSVMENAPVMLQYFARELGVSVAELKELASQGKITSDVMLRAFTAAAADAGESSLTLSQQLTNLETGIKSWLAGADESIGITRGLGAAMGFLAENISTAAKVVAVAGVGLATYFAPAIWTAITGGVVAATTAVSGFTAALLANPVVLGAAAVAAGVMLVKTALDDIAESSEKAEEAERQRVEAQEKAIKTASELQSRIQAMGGSLKSLTVDTHENISALSQWADSYERAVGDIDQKIEKFRVSQMSDRERFDHEFYSSKDYQELRRLEREMQSDKSVNWEARDRIQAARHELEAKREQLWTMQEQAKQEKALAEEEKRRADAGQKSWRERLALMRQIDAIEAGLLDRSRAATLDEDEYRYQKFVEQLNAIAILEDDRKQALLEQYEITVRQEKAREETLRLAAEAKKLEEQAAEAAEARLQAGVKFYTDLDGRLQGIRDKIQDLANYNQAGIDPSNAATVRGLVAQANDNGIPFDEIEQNRLRAELDRMDAIEAAQREFNARRLQEEISYESQLDLLRQNSVISQKQYDDELARHKEQTNAIAYERQLEQSKSFFSAFAGLSRASNAELAAIGKTAALTQIGISTGQAVMKALAELGPIAGAAAASGIVATSAMEAARVLGAGFRDGGWTGSGDRRKVAGVVHGQEFVLNADATRRIGRSNLELMNQTGQVPASAAGGGAGAANIDLTVAVLYDQQEFKNFVKSREGQSTVIEVIGQNRKTVQRMVS